MRAKLLTAMCLSAVAIVGCQSNDSEYLDAPPPEELDVRILEEPGAAPVPAPQRPSDTMPTEPQTPSDTMRPESPAPSDTMPTY